MQKAQGLIFQSVGVLIVGVGFALLANQLSPKGLSLTRNYFPLASTNSGSAGASIERRGLVGLNGQTNDAQHVVARLAKRGLSVISRGEVLRLFNSPDYQALTVIFIDSREDRYYREAHIPGALQFDHYRMEKYLEGVLPSCQSAEKIIVYCNGGECEDSELGAVTLTEFGIGRQKLAIYAEGFETWRQKGLPCETGERFSGRMIGPKK